MAGSVGVDAHHYRVHPALIMKNRPGSGSAMDLKRTSIVRALTAFLYRMSFQGRK
jgi:hypothetical protein